MSGSAGTVMQIEQMRSSGTFSWFNATGGVVAAAISLPRMLFASLRFMHLLSVSVATTLCLRGCFRFCCCLNEVLCCSHKLRKKIDSEAVVAAFKMDST